MAGQDPANDLEQDAFALLDTTTPAMREVLSCALDALDDRFQGMRRRAEGAHDRRC
jgi:hypothetical protein